MPRTASTDCAAAMSAIRTSRPARASTSAPIAAMNWVPLISARPSLRRQLHGHQAGTPQAPRLRPATRRRTRARPSPTSGSARCASGARSPLAPSDPRDGTTGCTPAFTIASSSSTVSRRTPDAPVASAFARSSIARARPRSGTARPPRRRGFAAGSAAAGPRPPARWPRRRTAEPGVHPVGRRARLHRPLDQRPRGLDLVDRDGAQHDLPGPAPRARRRPSPASGL